MKAHVNGTSGCGLELVAQRPAHKNNTLSYTVARKPNTAECWKLVVAKQHAREAKVVYINKIKNRTVRKVRYIVRYVQVEVHVTLRLTCRYFTIHRTRYGTFSTASQNHTARPQIYFDFVQ